MPGKKALVVATTRPSRRGGKGKRNKAPEALYWRKPMGAPMPPRYYCTLRTSLYGTINAATTSGHYFVIINEPGLPWVGGAWPNPSTSLAAASTGGFDQLCNRKFYQNYRCFSSRVKTEFMPVDPKDTIEVVITPSVDPTLPSNVASAINQPWSHRGIFSARRSQSNSRRESGALTHAMAVHTLLGVRPSAVEDDLSGRLQGNFNTAPTGLFYYVVNWVHMDAAATVSEIVYRVEVSYDVEFSNFSSGDLDY